MLEQSRLEDLFLAHLGDVDRIAAALARRHALSPDAAEDFASWVKLRLVEDDYAVFRKFRGESSITTYLTVVIAMLFRDYRVQQWGRWRPSSAARRHGSLAIRLETLVYRDGFTLQQAGELLRTTGETTLSDGELSRLFTTLPRRARLRPVEVGADAAVAAPGPERADELVETETREHEHVVAEDTLRTAIAGLPPEDQLIIRLRFWQGTTVADIARALGLPQKALYRRIERLLVTLRERLTAGGVSERDVHALLAGLSE